MNNIKQMYGSWVLVKRKKEREELSSIIFTGASEEYSHFCEVIAVGPGEMVHGVREPMEVKPGDIAISWAGNNNRPLGNDLFVLDMSQIDGKLEEDWIKS